MRNRVEKTVMARKIFMSANSTVEG